MYTMSEYIGGELSNATNNQTTYLGGMIIVDMPTQTARNVSTETLGAPRVGGGLVHSSRFGRTKNGTLVALGGMRSVDDRNNTFNNGELVIATQITSDLGSFADLPRLTSAPLRCPIRSWKRMSLGTISQLVGIDAPSSS